MNWANTTRDITETVMHYHFCLQIPSYITKNMRKITVYMYIYSRISVRIYPFDLTHVTNEFHKSRPANQ